MIISTLRAHRLRVLALVPLSLLLRADVCFEDGGFFGLPPPSTAETTTQKKLTLHLDAAHPTQRFEVPVSMTPPSASAHVDVLVNRATDTVRLEVAGRGFDNADRSAWPVVSTGFAGSVFLETSETQRVVLSIGLDDEGADAVADVDLDVIFACPADVDFDGLSDGVVVDIGPLEPLP